MNIYNICIFITYEYLWAEHMNISKLNSQSSPVAALGWNLDVSRANLCMCAAQAGHFGPYCVHCMYVCMYVCNYVHHAAYFEPYCVYCMHVCMYACMRVNMLSMLRILSSNVCMACMCACIHANMYGGLDAYFEPCVRAYMHVQRNIHIRMRMYAPTIELGC
jgi:hypothetical protein